MRQAERDHCTLCLSASCGVFSASRVALGLRASTFQADLPLARQPDALVGRGPAPAVQLRSRRHSLLRSAPPRSLPIISAVRWKRLFEPLRTSAFECHLEAALMMPGRPHLQSSHACGFRTGSHMKGATLAMLVLSGAKRLHTRLSWREYSVTRPSKSESRRTATPSTRPNRSESRNTGRAPST